MLVAPVTVEGGYLSGSRFSHSLRIVDSRMTIPVVDAVAIKPFGFEDTDVLM